MDHSLCAVWDFPRRSNSNLYSPTSTEQHAQLAREPRSRQRRRRCGHHGLGSTWRLDHKEHRTRPARAMSSTTGSRPPPRVRQTLPARDQNSRRPRKSTVNRKSRRVLDNGLSTSKNSESWSNVLDHTRSEKRGNVLYHKRNRIMQHEEQAREQGTRPLGEQRARPQAQVRRAPLDMSDTGHQHH